MTTQPQTHRYASTEYLSRAHGDEFVVIIDSLGRKWNPLLHPRDSKGRFIRTFSFVTFDMPDGSTASGRVLGIDRDGSLLVKVKGVTPGGSEIVKDKYVKVPHDKVEVRTVKAQLAGKGSHVGILQKQENVGVTNSIKSLRKHGMDAEADKLVEAQRLAMLPPNPRDPKSRADKERAIELFREVAESVDKERGKGFTEGEDYEEVKANLPADDVVRLQNLDDVTKSTFTARHSLGDKTVEGIETSQGTMSGNQPEVREQAAKSELAKDFTDDVAVYDITSGSLVEGHLEKPVKATVLDTVAEPQTEGLPEFWRSSYKKLSSGADRLTGSKQAQQVAPGDRHHVDKTGKKKVRVGHVVQVDATKKGRPAFTGMITRIYTDKKGDKHIYARDFDPHMEKGYTKTVKNADGTTSKVPASYKDHPVQAGSIEISSDDQQSTMFQKLALEGQDKASASLVKSFTEEYIETMRQRYPTPGALRRSQTRGKFFDVTPIHLRHKKDANGEKIGIGDSVQGPNGEDGYVSYMEPHNDTTKVYWRNGKSSRLAPSKLKRQHGPTAEVYPGESESGTNNYVPTREEAAQMADDMGADSVAEVIRNDGDSTDIQAAMVTDPAFQEKLFDIDGLYSRRDEARAAGQESSAEEQAELDKWDRMFMASAGYFREPDDPEPEPPKALLPDPDMEGDAPQNPDNPTEKITPKGVTVREEDGNVIVDDNTEDPIPSNDQQAIDQAVEDADGAGGAGGAGGADQADGTGGTGRADGAGGTDGTGGADRTDGAEADQEQATGEGPPAQSLASKLQTDLDRLTEEAKGAPNVDANQRAQLDKWMDVLNESVDAQDGDGVERALRGMTTTVNRQVNANLRQTRLAAVLNGRATNGVPMGDFVRQKLDAGEDIFDVPKAVSRPDRPQGAPDVTPEGVAPEADKVDDAVSEALLMDDGSSMVMVGDQQADEGFYVVDHATISEYEEMPEADDIIAFLNETEGSSFDGVSVWHDESDGRYRMARVGVFDDEQDASDAARTAGTNQYVDIGNGALMNVAMDGDQNSPSEAVEDPRSEERHVRVAGTGKVRGQLTAHQKNLFEGLSQSHQEDRTIASVVDMLRSGEEINGADASRLADAIDAMDVSEFDKPSDKGVASQMAHRLARASGEEGARGYSSQNTALRRTSDVGIALSGQSESDEIRSLVTRAREDIKNGDNAAAAAKFRDAADAFDAIGPGGLQPPAERAREHAARLDAMGGVTTPSPEGVPEAPDVDVPTPEAPVDRRAWKHRTKQPRQMSKRDLAREVAGQILAERGEELDESNPEHKKMVDSWARNGRGGLEERVIRDRSVSRRTGDSNNNLERTLVGMEDEAETRYGNQSNVHIFDGKYVTAHKNEDGTITYEIRDATGAPVATDLSREEVLGELSKDAPESTPEPDSGPAPTPVPEPAPAPTPAPTPEPDEPAGGEPEELDVGGTSSETLENLFDRIGQPADYGTEYQGRKLGEARALATEGLDDEAADALEQAAAQEPDGSDNQRLMQEAADALRGGAPETPAGDETDTGGQEAPVPIPFGRTLPEGWTSPPGVATSIRSEDGALVIANPDGTFTALRTDGTNGQFKTADEATTFADGNDPDTTASDEESVQAGLVNPQHPVPADFSRTADDTALTHVPSGDTITVEPDADADADKPYVVRDEDGAVQDRADSLDKAMSASDKDTDGDADEKEAEAGTPLQNVLSTHTTRDFSKDRNGNPFIDRKTGNPLTPHDARVRALRTAGRAQGREAFGSGNFYAVVGTTSIKAKVISGDREGFELDPSETDLFASLADQIAQSQVPQSTKDRLAELTDPASLSGKRMFVDAKGGAIVAVDADGRIHGPFTGNNAALRGAHGDAAEQLTRKAVRGGGRYAWSADDNDAQLLAHVGLKGTHQMPDGSIAYQYDPERVGEKYDRTKLTTAPNVATALKDHDNWRQQYESSPFHIALDQGEMGDTHVYVDVPDIDPKTGQQKVDKDGNPLTYSKKGPWGAHGASGLVVRAVDPKTGEDRFLMVQRSNAIGNSGKWQFGGGAINSNETGEQGAAREFFEETKPPAGWLGDLSHVGTNTTTNSTFNWDYANVAADTQTMFDPTLDYESEKALWLTRQDIADLEANGDLLPAVGASIRDTLTLWGQTPQTVLPAPSGNAATRAKAISHMPKKGAKEPAGPAPAVPEPGPAPAAPEPGPAPTPEPGTPETPEIPAPVETPAVPQAEAVASHGSIDDPGASYDNFTAGSNQGQRWVVPLSDGTTEKYFVKDFKRNPDAGRQEALASAFYRSMGLDAPEADFNEEESRLYSKWTDGLSSGSWTPQQKKEMRDGFAADAWLAAWDIRTGDNTVLTQDGKPFRLDNGGTMEYRAQGSKKGTSGTTPFGNTVGELDTFRNGQTQASQIYGTRGGRPDSWEADSGQRVVDLSDDEIRSLVSDYNLPDTLADTLIARKQDIATRYSLSPSADAPTNPSAPNAMKGTPDEVLSQAAKDADHPDGSVAGVEASSPAAPAAVAAGTARSLTHSKASDETKWTDDKDRSQLMPVAKVGDAHTLTMSDGSSKDYAVYKPKTADQGQRLQLASAFYNEMGIATPEVDYDAADDKVYAALTALGPDRGTAGHADVSAGFVMDAWLGNLRMSPKSISYAPDGTPIRSDLRGVLGSGKTPLDASGVGSALEGLRNPGVNSGASSIFGTRSGGHDDFEYDGAAEVISIPDDRIRELVAQAGLDSSMADTLIARRDGIRDYYNLVDPSTPVLAKVSFNAVNAADSLRDAKRGMSTDNKIGYVRSHMADGTSYSDLLKSSRGLDNAFDTLWRENNPDKPDSIFRGVSSSALGTPLQPVNNSGGSIATHDASKVTAQEVIDLVKDFDTSQEAWDDAATEFAASGSSGDNGQIALQLIQMQRGYQDANEEVSWKDFTKLVNSSHTHLFRGATEGTLQAIREGNWRGGTGMRAHGSGVYASTDINQALAYAGYGSGHIYDWAFEQDTANIADSGTLYGLASALSAAVARDSSLSADERRFLNNVLTGGGGWMGRGDIGALAALLGFDAIQGNNHYGYSYDFNILNKNRVVFAKKSKPYRSSKVSGSKVDDPDTKKAGYGNGVRNQELMEDLDRADDPDEEVPTGEAGGEGGTGGTGGEGGAGGAGGGDGGGAAI